MGKSEVLVLGEENEEKLSGAFLVKLFFALALSV